MPDPTEWVLADVWHVVVHPRWVGLRLHRTGWRVTGGTLGPVEFWRQGR